MPIVTGQLADSSVGVADTTIVPGALPTAPTPGNYLILRVRAVAVTTSNLNGWSQAVLRNNSNATAAYALFYRKVVSGDTAQAPSITLTTSQIWLAEIVENSGLAATSPLDQTASGETSGTATTCTSGTTPTTTQAAEEAFAGWGSNASMGGLTSVTNSFVPRSSNDRLYIARLDGISAIGTFETTVTVATARRIVGAIATFKSASSVTAVGEAAQVVWDVKAVVGETVGAQWDTRSVATETAVARWDVRSNVGEVVQARWDVRSAVGETVQARWDVVGAVGESVVVRWDLHNAVGETQQAKWNTRVTVGETVSARWDVLAALAPVGETVVVRWGVETNLRYDSIAYSTFATLTHGEWQALTYGTDLAPVGETVVVRWDTSELAGSTTEALWDTFEALGATVDARWDAASKVGESVVARWDVRSNAGKVAAARWDVRAAVGESFTAAWSIAATVGSTRSVQWATLATVGVTVTVEWSTAQVVGSFTAIRWDVVDTNPVGETATLRWRVRGVNRDITISVAASVVRAPLIFTVTPTPLAVTVTAVATAVTLLESTLRLIVASESLPRGDTTVTASPVRVVVTESEHHLAAVSESVVDR